MIVSMYIVITEKTDPRGHKNHSKWMTFFFLYFLFFFINDTVFYKLFVLIAVAKLFLGKN